ncbi:NAD-P-binding protein [Gymnopus androsaceus JB14]|uniref:NAD-P-binding protein n=1 Tax=Gymnopus androsaceus JB14 TaxID=1447944 RepID=A0A6A4HHA2_9AGAR|nr:NAD-P-binding protein [Gymnopus androsaceus JB14]
MSKPVVLITGCSEGGIGFTMASEFARRGCKVFATARNVDKMKGLRDTPNVELMALDVTSAENAANVVDHIANQEGRIDIVINNAGMACFGNLEFRPILEVPLEQIQAVYDTNILSVLRVSRAAVPHMAKKSPTPWCGVYASSKAAIQSITEVLQMECRPLNIKVMICSPGGIKTQIAQNAQDKFELQPNSLYSKYLDNIMLRMWASHVPGSMTAEEFAKVLADKAMGSNPPLYLTMGSHTTTFALLKWLPRLWALNFMYKRYATLKK